MLTVGQSENVKTLRSCYTKGVVAFHKLLSREVMRNIGTSVAHGRKHSSWGPERRDKKH